MCNFAVPKAHTMQCPACPILKRKKSSTNECGGWGRVERVSDGGKNQHKGKMVVTTRGVGFKDIGGGEIEGLG